MTFSAQETEACQRLIALALAEDLGTPPRDVTSAAVIPADLQGRAAFVARTEGVLAGLPAAELVAKAVDPRLQFTTLVNDGSPIAAPMQLAIVAGPMRSLLTAERTALNFLQRLSGVATQTRRYVAAVAGLPVQLLDTRKTTPGWRLLEKYAVRCGGGHNHRMGLFDGILIKDNHLESLRIADPRLRIAEAVRHTRAAGVPSVPLEIEVDTLEEFDAALAEKPAIILLDNMSTDLMREAVRRRNLANRNVKLEASGGVNLQTIRAIAETGVDRISVGALTHSAPALDIALDYLAG